MHNSSLSLEELILKTENEETEEENNMRREN